MQKRSFAAPLLALFLGAALGYGCHNNPPAQQQAGQPPGQAQTQPPAPEAPPPAVQAASPQDQAAAIRKEVEKTLARKTLPGGLNSPFPPGTQLARVDVQDGVATLDFNKAFNGVIDSGESAESLVQKALRRAVSHVGGVEKMRVTVEGKPFESQATDWNTPFPVRMEDDSTLRSESGRP